MLDGVVLGDPVGDHDPGFEHRVELLDVETLAAHAAVEAFDEGVLPEAGLLDEGTDYSLLADPGSNRLGDELASVVGGLLRKVRQVIISAPSFCQS